MLSVKKFGTNASMVKFEKSIRDVLKYYYFVIEMAEVITGLPYRERLAKREKDFLVCALAIIDQGHRNILSPEAIEQFKLIGKFASEREVGAYSTKKRIKFWLRKEKKDKQTYYRLPQIIESVLVSEEIIYNLKVKWQEN